MFKKYLAIYSYREVIKIIVFLERSLDFKNSIWMVRMKGLEPSRRGAPDPKSGVSANFTTSAQQ